jgi:hypothetical protein
MLPPNRPSPADHTVKPTTDLPISKHQGVRTLPPDVEKHLRSACSAITDACRSSRRYSSVAITKGYGSWVEEAYTDLEQLYVRRSLIQKRVEDVMG